MSAVLSFAESFITPDNAGQQILKVLAVICCAAPGGFLGGLVLQLRARGLSNSKVRPWMLTTIRVLSAIVVGWLAALILFRGEGTGPGGPGAGLIAALGGVGAAEGEPPNPSASPTPAPSKAALNPPTPRDTAATAAGAISEQENLARAAGLPEAGHKE